MLDSIQSCHQRRFGGGFEEQALYLAMKNP
jgi:hypothetical protein